ncbi:MAG: nucleotidyltransferase domain-containing protein [Propionibacteriaceae bacterium]|jgi:predicted nucleotidyltransferase/predicted DNA-binding protein|nr:nucleotidyltransferase domain-containing protein [Propionibacteriaceae bacterium]
MLALRLPGDVEERLDALARRTGRTKSFYARTAIAAHIAELEQRFAADELSAEETQPAAKMLPTVLRSRDAVLALANDRGVDNVRLFGSVARVEDGPESDVDFLVDPKTGTGVLQLIGLQHDLEQLLGRPVDVIPATGLKAHLRADVLAEAIAL